MDEKSVRRGLLHVRAVLDYIGNPPLVVVDEELFDFIWNRLQPSSKNEEEMYFDSTCIVCDTPEFNLTTMVAKKRGLFLTAKDLLIHHEIRKK